MCNGIPCTLGSCGIVSHLQVAYRLISHKKRPRFVHLDFFFMVFFFLWKPQLNNFFFDWSIMTDEKKYPVKMPKKMH